MSPVTCSAPSEHQLLYSLVFLHLYFSTTLWANLCNDRILVRSMGLCFRHSKDEILYYCLSKLQHCLEHLLVLVVRCLSVAEVVFHKRRKGAIEERRRGHRQESAACAESGNVLSVFRLKEAAKYAGLPVPAPLQCVGTRICCCCYCTVVPLQKTLPLPALLAKTLWMTVNQTVYVSAQVMLAMQYAEYWCLPFLR